MDRRIYIGSFCSLVATVAILATAIPVSTQTTGSFQYVIPHFNSNSGSELILSNLSSVLASAKVTFRNSEQAQVADAGINIPAGAQLRLTAGSLALSSFDGTVIVVSSSRLSVIATLSTGSGFESVVPATSSTDLIIPFSQGTTGRMKVTIYNPDDRSTSVVILPIAPDGTVLGNAAPTVAALGTLKLDIATLFPQPSTGPLRDISHLLIRVPKSVLGPDHRVFVQAEMINFSDAAEGIVVPHSDFSAVTAVPVGTAVLSGTIPFFVHGSDYLTELQFVNTSSDAGTVTLTARDIDGNLVPGTPVATVALPANGAARRSVQRVFNLGVGTTLGSIVFQSTTPVIAAEAIASANQSGFVVIPAGPQPDTNFVFSVRDFNPQVFIGLVFLNPSSSIANLMLQYVSDAGAIISSTTLTVDPSTQGMRTLANLFSGVRSAGFVYVSSDVPIIATALHVAVDNSVLGNLAAMHSQPDYAGPSSTAPPPTPVGPTAPSGSGSAAPTLTSFGVLLPVPLIAGNAGFTTTVTGTDFLPGVSVLINGVPRPTILLTPTTIQVTIPPEDLAIGGLVKVTAMNPSPTVGASNALDLPVMNPVPVVLSISPNSADVRLETNAPALPITVSGFGFKQGATILVAGTAIPTTFQNSNSLSGSIPQSSLEVGGAFAVSVVNPDPSVGPSSALPVLLSNLTPILAAVETDSLLTFDPTRPGETYNAPIVLRGSNFSKVSVFELTPPLCSKGLAIAPTSATVLIGGTQQFTAYLDGVATKAVTWTVNDVAGGNFTVGSISSTGLYTAPPAVPDPATVSVKVTSSSDPTKFAVATVTITSTPTATTGGVTGVGAVGATVVGSHEAVMTVTINCTGQYMVDVRNPQPGGGVSKTLAFNVVPFTPSSSPTIDDPAFNNAPNLGLFPPVAPARSPAFTLTITGSNFQPGAVVSFGSAVLFPALVTSTTITVTVPAYLVTQPGLVPVVVTNPTGGSSNRVLFGVN